MEERQTLAPGTTVYSSEAEPIGVIESSDTAYVFLEEGERIPLSAIAMSRDGEVHLSVTKADVVDQRWTQDAAVLVTPDQTVQAQSDYTAVQGEDSLQEDPMPAPGQHSPPAAPTRRTEKSDGTQRPSRTTGSISTERA